MTVNFWDHEGQQTIALVTSKEELLDSFSSFAEKSPFYCEFVSNNFKLSICIRGDLGSVQHSPANNDPPYRMAVSEADYDPEAEIDFFIGNEATPISARYAISLNAVKRIILFFMETGRPDPSVSWDDI